MAVWGSAHIVTKTTVATIPAITPRLRSPPRRLRRARHRRVGPTDPWPHLARERARHADVLGTTVVAPLTVVELHHTGLPTIPVSALIGVAFLGIVASGLAYLI
jgi:hypothetical protein